VKAKPKTPRRVADLVLDGPPAPAGAGVSRVHKIPPAPGDAARAGRARGGRALRRPAPVEPQRRRTYKCLGCNFRVPYPGDYCAECLCEDDGL